MAVDGLGKIDDDIGPFGREDGRMAVLLGNGDDTFDAPQFFDAKWLRPTPGRRIQRRRLPRPGRRGIGPVQRERMGYLNRRIALFDP